VIGSNREQFARNDSIGELVACLLVNGMNSWWRRAELLIIFLLLKSTGVFES